MVSVRQLVDVSQVQISEFQSNREGNAYIDTYNFDDHEESDDDDDVDEEDDLYDEYHDNNRVEDEDWEVAERDFTKQYNRLRQHLEIRAGGVQSSVSSTASGALVAALPAINQPRQAVSQSVNSLSSPVVKDKTLDQLTAFTSKYNSRLAKIDTPYVLGVGVNRKGPSAHANLKDKSDRATNEQVLDPRTRLILFKMIGRGLIDEVNGCISTGKEANVYHALTPEKKVLALKIYKTSILVFKDRDKYVTGEYRFRRGYSRRNPRKMVRVWAEKEMRNLKRLSSAGIRCPEPIEVRENVLVMTFLGNTEGWASPRLKDAIIPNDVLSSLYTELVLVVRRLFHCCKLVHADLSEYNILYHQNHLYIIDVSQSVEHDHPAAFDFLRNDIKNIEEFFGRLGVRCLGLKRCFEFITRERLIPDLTSSSSSRPELGVPEEEEILTRWIEQGEARLDGNVTMRETNQAHEDSVFMRSFIPRTLREVIDPERDVERLKKGQGNDLIYADTIGIVEPLSTLVLDEVENNNNNHQGVRSVELTAMVSGSTAPVASLGMGSDSSDLEGDNPDPIVTTGTEGEGSGGNEKEEEEEEEEEGDEEEEEEGSEIGGRVEKRPKGHRHEDREAKKERKRAVKTEAKERRKNKMSKAEKKRLVKRSRV